MTVLFIDYGDGGNKEWHDLWSPVRVMPWTETVEEGLRQGSPEFSAICLIVHHAEAEAEWQKLQRAISSALASGARPPFVLRVSTDPAIKSTALPNGWTCLSTVALPSYSPLDAYRSRFHKLISELQSLGDAPDPGALAGAWRAWNGPEEPVLRELGDLMTALSILAQRPWDGQGSPAAFQVDARGWWSSIGLSEGDPTKETERLVSLLDSKAIALRASSSPAAAEACTTIASVLRQVQAGSVERGLLAQAQAAIQTNYDLIYYASAEPAD